MATSSNPPATLRCEQCEFQNEAERVYCHNCGAKLDRSLLPKEEEKKQETPEKARKRIAKMTNPKSGSLLREIKTFFKVMIYAAIVAAVYLISQRPAGVPEVKREAALRLVSSDMMEALESPVPRAISFTENEVNQYLKQSLKSKEGMAFGFEFVRAYVTFAPGVVRVGNEQSLYGYPIYSSVDFQVGVKDGKFAATQVGGRFGRLSVDPRAMKYAEMAFNKLWEALKRERKQMGRMQSVTVSQGRIELVTKPEAR